MLVLIVIFLLINFIPIFTSVYLYYNSEDKRLYFAVYLYRFIKLASGYIVKRSYGGYYIHTFKNKAFIITLKDIITLEKGSHSYSKAFTLTKFYLLNDVGKKNLNIVYFFTSLTYLANKYKPVFYETMPFIEYKIDLNLYLEEENLISSKTSLTFYFTIFCIVKLFIANVIKKGVEYAKRKIQYR